MREKLNKNIVVRITEADHAKLKSYAFKQGRSISELFRLTVLNAIQHENKKEN